MHKSILDLRALRGKHNARRSLRQWNRSILKIFYDILMALMALHVKLVRK